MTRRDEHHQSRTFYDLSTLILNLLRNPPSPLSITDHSPPNHSVSSSNRLHSMPPISPAGFVSLLLGASLALMLCGSLTFIIGFMLMPWVVGFLVVLYVVGVVSSLSMLASAICYHLSPPPSPPALPSKDVPEWKVL